MLYCKETSPKKLGNSPLLLVPLGHHRGDGNDSQEITRQTPFSYIRGGLSFLSLLSSVHTIFYLPCNRWYIFVTSLLKQRPIVVYRWYHTWY